MAMHRSEALTHSGADREAIARAREWVVGMQSSDGGWGAFEPENTQYYLNNIPFSDHGALLDPPTADVSGRCLARCSRSLANSRRTANRRNARSTTSLKEQEADGSWYGRWGLNYIYGTWTALCSLNAAGHAAATIRASGARAQWLLSIQNEDGVLGRGRRELQARLSRLRARAEHGVANGMGADGFDGGGRGRSRGCARAASRTCSANSVSMVCGTRRALRRRASRACFICVTTVIASSSRCGRWRGTVI